MRVCTLGLDQAVNLKGTAIVAHNCDTCRPIQTCLPTALLSSTLPCRTSKATWPIMGGLWQTSRPCLCLLTMCPCTSSPNFSGRVEQFVL